MHPSDEETSGQAGRDPLSNRFTRATAVGCLGIAGVMALPALLLLPLEDWHLPAWLTHMLAIAAFGALAGGAWLLTRVPAARPAAATDARYPLTHTGMAPVVERPASGGNRAALVAVWGLAILALAAYVLANVPAFHGSLGADVALIGCAGLACGVLGVLVAARRAPVPAWSWVRTPIRADFQPQGVALVLFGGAGLGWALLAAAGNGYGWGVVGLAILVLGSVVATPVLSRWPRGGRPNMGADVAPRRGPGAPE
jgi:hypothetical protein